MIRKSKSKGGAFLRVKGDSRFFRRAGGGWTACLWEAQKRMAAGAHSSRCGFLHRKGPRPVWVPLQMGRATRSERLLCQPGQRMCLWKSVHGDRGWRFLALYKASWVGKTQKMMDVKYSDSLVGWEFKIKIKSKL